MGNLASAIDELLATDVAGSADAVLAGEVAEIVRAQARLAAALADRVAALDARGIGDAEHHGSTAGWLREACRLSPRAAGQLVHLARDLARLPVTRDALADADIDVERVQVIALLRRDLSEEAVSAAEPYVVRAAGELTVDQLRRWVNSVRHSYAPGKMLADEAEQYADRALSVAKTFRGTGVGSWTLPPVLHETVLTALHAASPPVAGDDRSAAQRRADALVTLAEIALRSGELPVIGGVLPHLTVIATVETLTGAPGAGAADYGFGATSSGEWARRVGCDAEVARVVFGPQSEVLDSGRAMRCFTAAQRRAIVARDRGCIWPGCQAPAPWCEAHHRCHWAHGGVTSVDNGVLLCGRHHDRVHLHQLAIHQTEHGHYTVDTRTGSAHQPRGPDQRAGP